MITLINNLKLSRVVILLGIVLFSLLLFTRFYNLDRTARFSQDESSDLVRMQQYISQRRITLVGPISNDNSKVFGSLTYYMLIPFVAAGNSLPISPVYGTAFWGVLTVLILVALSIRMHQKIHWLAAILLLVWYPLIETSRWAWNPHYVIFWIALGALFYSFKNKLGFFLTGISFALAFHNHYIAVIATGVFVLIAAIIEAKNKRWQHAAYLVSGYILPYIPFVIFDLRHPPGLFFGKYLLGGDTPHVVSVSLNELLLKIAQNFLIAFNYIAATPLSWIVMCFTGVLMYMEKKNFHHWLWILPVLAQVIVGTFLESFETRYFLPAIIFYLVWLLLPRKGVQKLLATVCIVTILIGSLFTFIPQITKTKYPPDIYSLTAASQYIAETSNKHSLKNINVAALSSKDSDPLAAKYRDVLNTLDTSVLAASQYEVTENLFVITTSDEVKVRQDKSVSMLIFKDSKLGEVYEVPNSNWRVLWFHY